jgi:hypothetical protein
VQLVFDGHFLGRPELAKTDCARSLQTVSFDDPRDNSGNSVLVANRLEERLDGFVGGDFRRRGSLIRPSAIRQRREQK